MADMRGSLRRFELDVARFSQKLNVAAETLQKSVAVDLLGRIIRRTPKDTGRAQASWTIAVNRADRSVQPDGRKSYTVPPVPKITVKPGGTIWISNNLAYIVALEKGHSKQAPHGMVALSVEEVKNELAIIERDVLRGAGL